MAKRFVPSSDWHVGRIGTVDVFVVTLDELIELLDTISEPVSEARQVVTLSNGETRTVQAPRKFTPR